MPLFWRPWCDRIEKTQSRQPGWGACPGIQAQQRGCSFNNNYLKSRNRWSTSSPAFKNLFMQPTVLRRNEQQDLLDKKLCCKSFSRSWWWRYPVTTSRIRHSRTVHLIKIKLIGQYFGATVFDPEYCIGWSKPSTNLLKSFWWQRICWMGRPGKLISLGIIGEGCGM